MKWIIIRHGTTKGNTERRFSGITDDPLIDEGIRELIEKKSGGLYSETEQALENGAGLYVSPMKRCTATAEILFPGRSYSIEKDLHEIDFGEFEGKNHAELNGLEAYQEWIDLRGKAPFPGGESREEYILRIRGALRRLEDEALKEGKDTVVIVAHGGTIMSAREILAGGDFYDEIPENGGVFTAETKTEISSM